MDLKTFMGATVDPAKELMMESGRVEGRPDVELGSLATNEFGSKYPISVVSPDMTIERKRPIATHSKKVLLADDGSEHAMGNKVYGHITREHPARESRPSNGSGHQKAKPRSESTMRAGDSLRDSSTNKRQSPNSSQQQSKMREKKQQPKSGLAMI